MSQDVDRVSAWAALLRVHAAVVPKLERELVPTGLPLSWYDALLELNDAPGRKLRMTELGQRVVLSRERVSRVVGELERAGLVRREPNPDDGRSSFAAITPEGRVPPARSRADLSRGHRAALFEPPHRLRDPRADPRPGSRPRGRGKDALLARKFKIAPTVHRFRIHAESVHDGSDLGGR